jgi:uncharacterized protein YaeQ
VRRILHKDLNLQELSDRDMAHRSTVDERVIGILLDDGIILMTDEAHFQQTEFSLLG